MGDRIETGTRTAVALVAIPAAIAFYGTGAMALAIAGATARSVHRMYLGLARFCLRVGSTQLEVHGAEHLDTGRSYVVVANHASNLDPMCILAGLPDLCIRFVVKRQLIRIPIFGTALRLTGSVVVNRSRTGEDVQRIRERMGQRAPEVSVLFFAEGTRSRDGALHPFKMGAFATALTSGLPLLPVGLAGTFHVLPPGVPRVRRGAVVLEVGEPIPTADLDWEERGALRDRAHRAVVELRTRARQRLRDRGCEPGGLN